VRDVIRAYFDVGQPIEWSPNSLKWLPVEPPPTPEEPEEGELPPAEAEEAAEATPETEP
jgi:hypothetical protein